MTDIIRKAVELADGWSVSGFTCDGESHFTLHINSFDIDIYSGELEPFLKDALAAQLVRQVDETESYTIEFLVAGTVRIWHKGDVIISIKGPDRTMNTIKAIVDSGVLIKNVRMYTDDDGIDHVVDDNE